MLYNKYDALFDEPIAQVLVKDTKLSQPNIEEFKQPSVKEVDTFLSEVSSR